MSNLQDPNSDVQEPAVFPETSDAIGEPKKSKRTIWIIAIVAVLLLLCCCCLLVGVGFYLSSQQIDFEQFMDFSRLLPLIGAA